MSNCLALVATAWKLLELTVSAFCHQASRFWAVCWTIQDCFLRNEPANNIGIYHIMMQMTRILSSQFWCGYYEVNMLIIHAQASAWPYFYLAKMAKGLKKTLAKFNELSKLSKFDCQVLEIVIFSLANLAIKTPEKSEQSHTSLSNWLNGWWLTLV